MTGPLHGTRVLDLSRYAPGRYCTMLLSDYGADVLQVEAPGDTQGQARPEVWQLEREPELAHHDALMRGKLRVPLDLKSESGRARLAELVAEADVLVEGFRPGVAERLGAGWEECHAANPRLVYCSITGFDRNGPDATTAGHDINFIAAAGALGMIGTPDGRPAIPANIVADFAGGGLYAALAISLALHHRNATGEGQRVDVAMEDGVLSLLTRHASLFRARGPALEPRAGDYYLSGARPDYSVYESADGRWFAVGALERPFFAALCRATGRPDLVEAHGIVERVPDIREHLAAWFRARPAAAVVAALAGSDSCVTLVSTFAEALDDAARRGLVTDVAGSAQIGPAIRFSRTPGEARPARPEDGSPASWRG